MDRPLTLPFGAGSDVGGEGEVEALLVGVREPGQTDSNEAHRSPTCISVSSSRPPLADQRGVAVARGIVRDRVTVMKSL